jgi:PAS domain S-box-containing protein
LLQQFLRSPRRHLTALAVVCFGIFASALCFHTLRSLEVQRAQSQFRRAAQGRFDELQADMDLTVDKVLDLSAFCQSSYPVTRSSFVSFATLISREETGIQALEWAPQLPLAQRAAMERAARAEGLAGFEIRDRITQGEMVRAGSRPNYSPVLYAYPEAGNELALGYDDLAANSVRREVLQRAAASGALSASARITLAQETGQQLGILLVHPVYERPSGHSGNQAAKRLLGFVEGVLRVGPVVERHGQGSGIALSIMDLSASPAEQQLYSPSGVRIQPASEFIQYRTIAMGGRSWRIAASPVAGAFPVSKYYSYAGSALCLLFTLMVAVLAAEMLGRSEQVERLVEERSRALSAAVASLEKAHSGLEESEARYRHLVENSPDAIVVERPGKIVLANRAALEMFGFDPSHELKGRSILDFVTAEDRELAGQLHQQLSERAMQIPPQQIRVLRLDGQALDAEFTASSFLHEGSHTIQIVLRDISQRKHDEAVTARLFSAIEQVRESIVITDPEGRIVYVNPAFERVTGYSRQEALGQNPRMLKSTRHSGDFYARIWQVLTRGEVWSGRLINRAKDGHLFTEEATIAPVVNRSGQLINYVAVKRDVTLETELQERLHQSQKMDAIGRLAGGVAHDFNNMLMVIVSYAEMALESLDKDDPARSQISQVLRAAHRSFALTRQLLAFSRKQLLAPQVLDCNAIVSETSSMVRRLISENIELRCELASGLWPVKADPDQIMQVILNLCVNSRDAMPNGGSILLATRNDVSRSLVEISVSDTGTGIPLDLQKKLFEPFFTTKEPGKGTGLGLATVYGIAAIRRTHSRQELAGPRIDFLRLPAALPGSDGVVRAACSQATLPGPLRNSRSGR